MLAQGQITEENGEKMTPILTAILFAVIVLPTSTYFYSCVIMLRQCIKYQGRAYELTEYGIENTITAIVFLAFVFVLPVKRIPWHAIRMMEKKKRFYQVIVSVGMVDASLLAKAIIFIRGYNFCHKFSTPYVAHEEINYYYQVL